LIRSYRQSDIDQVISIWLESSIIAHDFIDKSFWESNVKEMRDKYIPASETYVFEDNGKIIGFLSLYGERIAAIFVTPNKQGKGVGAQLLESAKQQKNKLDLTVYKENRKSIKFYERHGFKVVKEQIDENTGHLELLMEFES